MSVHDHGYRPYDGPLTSRLARLAVIPRYAYREAFRSRLFLIYFTGCFLPAAVAGVLIYLRYNAPALDVLDLRVSDLIVIDAAFFLRLLILQGGLAFIIALLLGPDLISADLQHLALPLYLARPISRAGYVLGKAAVLAILISAITWVVDLPLFALQGYLDLQRGGTWWADNGRTGVALFVGSWVWIWVLCLLSLTVSAWVRRRSVARAAMIALFFVLRAVGGLISDVYGAAWGVLLDLNTVIRYVWAGLFGPAAWEGILGVGLEPSVPVWTAWAALGVFSAVALALLSQRVRPVEVAS